jgi:subtilisin family serine protease
MSFVLCAAGLLASLPLKLPDRAPIRPLVQPAGRTSLSGEEAARARSPAAALSRPTRRLLAQLGIDRWHAAGYRGRGVKVAILDSGFRGYRQQLGKALPARVTVHSFRRDGNLEARNSQHAILCGAVIHTLAPEAELLFANWEPRRPDKFLEAVRWARKQGARVISCSVIMPGWSDGEGGGEVHQALARILGDGAGWRDLLCFASAGNTAQRTWSGKFLANAKGFHQWKPGQWDNRLVPWEDDNVSVELSGPEGAEYEMSVVDPETAREVARSASAALKGCSCAVVRFLPQTGHTYNVRLRLTKGKPGTFHCVALHSDLEYATQPGSICFPADGPEVIAVGAVNKDGKRASYSACGPNSKRPKPDLVAPVPFRSSWRSQPFAGTSAAAPQAAALTALLWSRHPDWTASRVRRTLEKSARDLGPPGHDCETGYGMIHLP